MADIIKMTLKDDEGILYGITAEMDSHLHGEDELTHLKITGQQTARGTKHKFNEGENYPLREIASVLIGKAIVGPNYHGGKSRIEIEVEEGERG